MKRPPPKRHKTLAPDTTRIPEPPADRRYHRGNQVVRQWRIIRLLLNTPAGLTCAQISKSLSAHERTIYRDLEQLRDAGFPVYWRPGEGRGPGAWHIAGSELTEAEQRFFRGEGP